MEYDPQKHHRRSIRLKGYDYHNAGVYFVTICTKNRECVLKDPIVNGIINDVWLALPSWFPTIILDEFIIMPNHIHFILWLMGCVQASLVDTQNVGVSLADTQYVGASLVDTQNGTGASPVPTGWVIPKPEKTNIMPALGDAVGAFKSLVFKVYLDWIEINDPSRRAKFWQHNYYEHIIRNERELNAIRQYIVDNPINWDKDRDNQRNSRRLPPPEKVEDYLLDVEEML